MNKIQIIVDVCLCAGMAVLFGLYFSLRHPVSSAEGVNSYVPSGEIIPVAYLNTDSILVNYKFAQEASERLMSKQEDARLKLNTKAKTLQQEMADFQRKLDNNAFLSRERAESEQQRLIKKQQELEELENQLTQEIVAENQKLNMQLADTLTNLLNIFNADGHIHLIFANNSKDNILMAAPQYDITSQIVDALNKRYNKK